MRQQKFITISWDGDSDETRIKFSPAWKELYQIAKLDILKDAIDELEIIYSQTPLFLKEGI